MPDPYADIRKLAEDETRLISAESYNTLRCFVLAALPVVEAAGAVDKTLVVAPRERIDRGEHTEGWLCTISNGFPEIMGLRDALARFKEATDG